MGNINFRSYCKFNYCFGGDEMNKIDNMAKPSYLLRLLIHKGYLQKGYQIEIFSIRGMLSAFLIQKQMTHSSWLRFDELLKKAQNKELKLNIKKDKK
jgi:hypothetical protein